MSDEYKRDIDFQDSNLDTDDKELVEQLIGILDAEMKKINPNWGPIEPLPISDFSTDPKSSLRAHILDEDSLLHKAIKTVMIEQGIKFEHTAGPGKTGPDQYIAKILGYLIRTESRELVDHIMSRCANEQQGLTLMTFPSSLAPEIASKINIEKIGGLLTHGVNPDKILKFLKYCFSYEPGTGVDKVINSISNMESSDLNKLGLIFNHYLQKGKGWYDELTQIVLYGFNAESDDNHNMLSVFQYELQGDYDKIINGKI